MNAKQIAAASLPPSWAGMADTPPSWAADSQTGSPSWAGATNAPVNLMAYAPWVLAAAVAFYMWRKA
jgi:hypothetical protein